MEVQGPRTPGRKGLCGRWGWRSRGKRRRSTFEDRRAVCGFEGKGPQRAEERRRGRREVGRPCCPSTTFSSLPAAVSFILLTNSRGAFLDHMFHPLSPAKQPYYMNLLSFPGTGSLPVTPTSPRWVCCQATAAQAWLRPDREQRPPGILLAWGPPSPCTSSPEEPSWAFLLVTRPRTPLSSCLKYHHPLSPGRSEGQAEMSLTVA